MFGDYSIMCDCGHVENQHRRVLGTCRGARCKCDRFINKEYAQWLERIALDDLNRARKMQEESLP